MDENRRTIGAMWEHDHGWQILTDVMVGEYESSFTPCPHCHSKTTKQHTPRIGVTYETTSWICPRVIEAFNEGGHCSTGVCADCVLDAIKNVPRETQPATTNAE